MGKRRTIISTLVFANVKIFAFYIVRELLNGIFINYSLIYHIKHAKLVRLGLIRFCF